MIDEKKLAEWRALLEEYGSSPQFRISRERAIDLFNTLEKLWRIARAAQVYRVMERPYSTLDAGGFDEALTALDDANAPKS